MLDAMLERTLDHPRMQPGYCVLQCGAEQHCRP